jgi:alkylhydroperoxidase/carboxymuconolactone decarboxylase family protein YurZ
MRVSLGTIQSSGRAEGLEATVEDGKGTERDRPSPLLDGSEPNSPKEDAMAAMKEFAGIFYREGALEAKTMQLVALAALAAAGCPS